MVERADTVTDFSQFTTLRAQARGNDPAVVRKAAQQFEALFTQQLLKSMRASSLGDDVMGGGQTGFYQDLFDQQMATHLSSSGKGLGLADVLVRQLRGGALAGDAQPQAAANTSTSANAVNPAQAGIQRLLKLAEAVGAQSGFSGFQNPLDSRLHGNDSVAATTAERSDQNKPSATERAEFVQAIRPHAERAARELGLPPQMLIAQAALETGWGRNAIHDAQGQPTFNFFGIKADRNWQGAEVQTRTTEYVAGRAERQDASFRAYGSAGEAFDNYVGFLKSNPRYADALRHGGDMQHFASGLQKAGYATDPDYAQKLMRIANGATLRAAYGNAAGVSGRRYAV